MSVRTICEFNHDYAHKISAEPEEFVRLLRLALNSGDKETWGELERFGLNYVVMGHHSYDRKVVMSGYEIKIG